MPILSIIILSYNTKDITKDCIDSLIKSLSNSKLQFEIIVVDNASNDGSQEMITSYKKQSLPQNVSFLSILNSNNDGFPKGNNAALVNAKGTYVLFLNSDVLIDSVDWDSVLAYLDQNSKVAALTVHVKLPSGAIDPASHRGFPSIWNSFCYYSKLEYLTSSIPLLNRVFGGYHLTHLNHDEIHEVDAISGAFFLARTSVVKELGGFDETFFMYGEDLDLAYRMKEMGYVLIYYPSEVVTHLKYQSGMKKGSRSTEKTTREYFYDAMRIFYKKHYDSKYPRVLNKLMYVLIDIKERLG